MNKDIEKILFSSEEISVAVKCLGEKLTRDYMEKTPVFICILKGATVFFSDLVRAVSLPAQIDFLRARSYGMSHKSSGVVEIVKDIETDIEGKDIILVEDIIDSGETLSCLGKVLRERKPNSLKIVTLVDKKIKRECAVAPDYKCFDVEDEFIVGYGLDYAENYRTLPYIGVLKRALYS
ncbi:MAG: hypoxanthine phosphoribosyltransferase [Oscillospiraceae bacterium]|nr:hypoxanthine phosphoribosyltransferase [Oscillospiraceae bacterium]